MTYAEIVAKIDIDWCPEPGGTTMLGSKCRAEGRNHARGYADVGRGLVHWQDRGVNKRGLRRFLMLAAACRKNHNRGQPRWQQIYEQSTWASSTALNKLQKVLPHRHSALDRVRVEWLLRKEKDPDKSSHQRIRAANWAHNRYRY